jgi:hypothetical protein
MSRRATAKIMDAVMQWPQASQHVTDLLTGWPARAATGLRILLTNTSGPSRTSAA